MSLLFYPCFIGIILPMFFKKRFLNLILIGAAILGLSACASLATPPNTPTPAVPTSTPIPPTATPPPSVANVNGEYVTIAEFEAELARYKEAQAALGIAVTDEEANRIVLEDMIAQVLLAQSARAQNFEATDSELQARIAALESQIGGAEALAAWMSAHGYDQTSFHAALKRSVEAAWMRDKIVADTPKTTEQIHLRQILTYNAINAEAAYQQLGAGADFDELAALYDPVTLGELGWIPQGYLLDAKADAAVFALQAGQYSEVIATDAGFHIFKVIERGEHPLAPDALLAMQEQALKKWVEEKRASGNIVLAP